jgi:hypothetical protein
MQKLTIIIGGFIGILPAGGVTWDYIQYPLGFRQLGHEVYYIEDTRLYPIYQSDQNNWDDSTSCIAHLEQVMSHFGMRDRWAYRDEASGNCFGLTEKKIKEICKAADIFVNVSCSTYLRDEYLQIPVRVLIDSDPMFTQIQYLNHVRGITVNQGMQQMIEGHNHLFTFGENIGADDCRVPTEGLKWIPTRQPVCLGYWKVTPYPNLEQGAFTTLMNWAAFKSLKFDNEYWGQKDVEFKKIFFLPQFVDNIRLSAVVSQTGGTNQVFNREEATKIGWQILDADSNAGNWEQYQQFIISSVGEFSVAKETYVKARTGWFSCRSACYLASGRPVVTQDTGWSSIIPSGKGLFAFQDIEGAKSALEAITADYKQHVHYARMMAEEFFDSSKVLNKLLSRIN